MNQKRKKHKNFDHFAEFCNSNYRKRLLIGACFFDACTPYKNELYA